MRILYIYPFCSLGGVETSVLNKMEALKKIGIHAEALFQNVWCESGKYMLKNPGIKTGLNEKELISTINNYDIITIIDYPEIFNIIDKYNVNIKILYETHCSDMSQAKSSYKVLNHPKIKAILVPSVFNSKMILKMTTVSKLIYLLPNPINVSTFNNISISNLRDDYQEYFNKINIIWIGRLEENKNPIEFIKIGNILLDEYNKLHFILVGDICNNPNYFSFIKSNIPSNKISNFTFIHSIKYEKMPEIYSLSANTGGCLVSTSKNESLPMILLEAMSCKCPVVSTNVGGITEIVLNNCTGKIYELNNISAGADAIRQLIQPENAIIRNKIINNAYTKIMLKHSLDRVISIYKFLLNFIIRER